MAKFSFFEVRCTKRPKVDDKWNEIPGADPVVTDNVLMQITKNVNMKTMRGQKSEDYIIDVVELPGLFGVNVTFPAFVGMDGSERTAAVKNLLDKYIGQSCDVEEIAKGSRKLLTYIEFHDRGKEK